MHNSQFLFIAPRALSTFSSTRIIVSIGGFTLGDLLDKVKVKAMVTDRCYPFSQDTRYFSVPEVIFTGHISGFSIIATV